VMMVVEVLMISCQVSEKPKIGPVDAQITTANMQSTNASGRPAQRDTVFANAVKARVGSTTL
jgi:hypothetical protein